jgi:hypothetical protein
MAAGTLSLEEIGRQEKTDKSTIFHGYLDFYEPYLAAHRHKPVKLLEIGVETGASLRMWQRYFPNGAIVGADINPATLQFAEDRIAIELLDQSNLEDLVALGVKHGPFDIIVEDGSHEWEHQITTLRTLFPFLKSGGIYIVEDLHTNYGQRAEQYRGVASMSCMDYLKRAVDLRVADTELDLAGEEDAFLRTYATSMTLSFFRRVCLIQKAYNSKDYTNPLWPPAIPASALLSSVPFGFTAHLSYLGDMKAKQGAVTGVVRETNIQGVELHVEGAVADDLECRARLDDGTWTQWCRAGAFVGTRGAGTDLTGIAVRLRGALAERATVRVAGWFSDHPLPVIVGDGADCVPGDTHAPLHALQILLLER